MARYDPWRGFKVSDLLDFSPTKIGAMEERQIRALITKLSSAANKRVRNLRKSGVRESVLPKVLEPFSARGKETKSDLLGEYSRVVRFMKSERSTVRGARKAEKSIGEAADILVSKGKSKWKDDPEARDLFWKLYGRWYEVARGKGLDHYELTDIIGAELDAGERDYDRLEILVKEGIDRVYQERERAREDYDSALPNII